MIASVVVEVEDANQLAVIGDAEIFGTLDALTKRLSGILFHLNVVKLAVKTEEHNY